MTRQELINEIVGIINRSMTQIEIQQLDVFLQGIDPMNIPSPSETLQKIFKWVHDQLNK